MPQQKNNQCQWVEIHKIHRVPRLHSLIQNQSSQMLRLYLYGTCTAFIQTDALIESLKQILTNKLRKLPESRLAKTSTRFESSVSVQ